ncbi:MAG: hypothetical protein QNJ55_12890 [Xenococcus sp. MO_188.B8]|nr:hypothetical protein [Xenococcus sp. MO_188.B8]
MNNNSGTSVTTSPSRSKDPLSKKLAEFFPHLQDAIALFTQGWKTLKHPLHKALLFQKHRNPNQIIGVRFGKETKYLAADIDRLSSIHPAKNPMGYGKFLDAMERIGLCRHISLQSSWSGGLHLYFSLPKKVNTYDAACLIKWACLKAGLIITPGHLELFPNTKNYVPYNPKNPNQQFSLYNGLRLPCQPGTGSFLLDSDFNPVSDRIETFLDWAERDAQGQDFAKFKRLLKTARKRLQKLEKRIHKKLSQNAQEWKKDLETIITTGWTGHGETNDLLSRMVRYAIVFLGETGKSLRNWVKQVATNAPGYQKWCRHRHEIDKKIEYWCRSTENNQRYLAYRSFPGRDRTFKQDYPEAFDKVTQPKEPNQNQLKAQQATERIKQTVAKLEAENRFPQGAVERTIAIATESQKIFGTAISKSTLRKPHNLAQWHPKHKPELPLDSEISQTQTATEVSYTPKPKSEKNEQPQTQTATEVSYTLAPMKCVGQLEVRTEDLIQEQAPPRLASQPENLEMSEPLTRKILNPQPASEESHSSTEMGQIPTKESGKCNSSIEQKQDENQLISTQSHSTTNSTANQSLAERSPKSLLSKYREIIKVRCVIEKKVRTTTREYLHAAYPGIKNIPPRGLKAKIESQSRARLFWSSGIPELMKRAEEIWLELGDEW